MKKKVILPFLLIILLIIPFASASIFDWINNLITGRATEETVPVAMINEQVKCTFLNSNSEQKCYTSDGKFSCSGAGGCAVDVSGETGAKLEWTSSCGGYAYTTIDENNEAAEFKCESTTPMPTTQCKLDEDCPKIYCVKAPCPIYVCKEGNCVYSAQTPTPIPAETIKEQIRCVFKNSNVEQKCHTVDGKYSCSGIGSCAVDTYGQKGAQVTWGSSCGGYDYTFLDGNSEDAEFECGSTSASTSTRDRVKLHYFYWEKECPLCESEKSFLEKLKVKYPQVEYDSYIIDGPDKGSYSYFVVANLKQGMPTIFFDDKIWVGYNDNIAAEIESKVNTCIEKGCSLTPSVPATATAQATQTSASTSMPVQEVPTYKVKLYFFWKKDCEDCMRGMEFAKLLLQKYQPLLRTQLIDISSQDAMNYFSNVVKSVGAETSEVPTTIVDDKIWVGYNDNIAREIEKKVIECVEKGCRIGVQPAVPTQTMPVSDMAKEQVECIFWNSDVLQNPHTARPEECYSNRFGCKWTGEVVEKEVNGNKVRYAYCIAEVFGEKGTQLVWKSSCGGYAYTTIDGNNEAAEFKCTPSAEVKEEQISGKGFKRAYWQCYDGAEQKAVVSESVPCESSEVWQKEAEEFCNGHCYSDGSKCGVNSFSVMDECYIEAGKEGVIFTIPEKPKGGKKFAMPPNSKIGDIMVVYFYSDACRFCLGMDEELNKVSKELNIYINRVNIINEPELAESYGIKGVPAFLVLKYGSDGIKEFLRYGKADSTAIINWIAKPEIEVQEKPAEIDQVKEKILVICKDSCPLDGKCYPFGYRKGGNFCSDEGTFKEQLKADAVCENSFECSTNVCVDGKCMSSGLIQKVINWFKSLFG